VLLDGTRQRVLVYHVVMASRKPKGIADDIVGGIRNIVSPWLGAPAGQNSKVTQAQGLARSAAQTLDQTFAGGMIGAGVKGNKALANRLVLMLLRLVPVMLLAKRWHKKFYLLCKQSWVTKLVHIYLTLINCGTLNFRPNVLALVLSTWM
jgi:hypothetical protein